MIRTLTKLKAVIAASALAMTFGCSGAKAQTSYDESRSTGGAATMEMESMEVASEKAYSVEKPFLWRIKRDEPAWLFGTIHIPDTRVTTLPPVVDEALSSVDAFYAELPLDMETQSKMITMVMRTDGSTLKESLPPETWTRLKEKLAEFGVPIEVFNMWKTVVVVMQLQLLEYMEALKAGELPLDMYLYSRSSAAGKEVGGVETIEEQMGIFDSLTEEEQIKMVGETLDLMDEMEAEGISSLQLLVDAYLEGDEANLMKVMFDAADMDDETNQKMMEKLLDKRNHLMTERIDKMLKANPEKSYFFAIGAAHYPGEVGLVKLLEDEGWEIERITNPE